MRSNLFSIIWPFSTIFFAIFNAMRMLDSQGQWTVHLMYTELQCVRSRVDGRRRRRGSQLRIGAINVTPKPRVLGFAQRNSIIFISSLVSRSVAQTFSLSVSILYTPGLYRSLVSMRYRIWYSHKMHLWHQRIAPVIVTDLWIVGHSMLGGPMKCARWKSQIKHTSGRKIKRFIPLDAKTDTLNGFLPLSLSWIVYHYPRLWMTFSIKLLRTGLIFVLKFLCRFVFPRLLDAYLIRFLTISHNHTMTGIGKIYSASFSRFVESIYE